MPESNKAERRRIQKANRENGIGDELGRIVRVKDPPKMSLCTICQAELRITRTNTELTAHANGKHGKTIQDCFPGATEIAQEMANAGKPAKSSGGGGGESKAAKKKKEAASVDDLLSAGLSAGKKQEKR